MAQTKLRLPDLDKLPNPAGGVALVNKGGVDYQVQVEKFLLGASDLSDEEKQVVIDGLGTLSEAEILKLATPESSKMIQRLMVLSQSMSVDQSQLVAAVTQLNENVGRNSAGISRAQSAMRVLTSHLSKVIQSNADIEYKILKIQQYAALSWTNYDRELSRELQRINLRQLMTQQLSDFKVLNLNGLDPMISGGGTSSGSDALLHDSTIIFPEPQGIIKIELTSETGVPTSKNDPDRSGSYKITIDGQSWTGYATFGVQGASSAGYPKKNLSIAAYSDMANENSLDLKIGNIVPHDEWVFKANWIDQTQARNLLCYHLWDIVKASRPGWPRMEIDQSYVGKVGQEAFPTGAAGHPVGYPCVMYFNGEFYGIGSFMVGKRRENYNCKKSDETKIIIGLDDHVDMVNFDKGYEIRNPKKPTDATTAVIEDYKTFTKLPQEEFSAAFDTYLDRANVVDFYLFITFLNAYDCTDKNTLMVTWNGKKWFFMVYDLDTSLGLNWAGGSVGGQTSNTFKYNRAGVEYWDKVYVTLEDELKARWAELRKNGTYQISTIYDLYMVITKQYTPKLLKAEAEKWPTLPSWNQSTFDQINNWLKTRLPYLDKLYGYTETN